MAQIELSLGLVSLSAKEANWWKNASPARRKRYIEKHPRSKYAKAVNAGKLKVDAPSKSKKPAKPKAKPKSKSIPASKPTARKPKAVKVNRKKPVSRKARAQDQIIREEEQRRVEEESPILRREMQDNLSGVRQNKAKIVNAVSRRFSQEGRKAFNKFSKQFLRGKFNWDKADDATKRGAKMAGQVLEAVTQNVIGRSRYKSGLKNAGTILLSLFMGPTNYKKAFPNNESAELESSSSFSNFNRRIVDEVATDGPNFAEDIMQWFDDMVNLRFQSQSASEDEDEEEADNSDIDADEEELDEDEEDVVKDTIDSLITAYTEWLRDLDLPKVARKLSELHAIREMVEEGYTPDPDSVEQLLEDEEEAGEDLQPVIPEDVDQFESDSGAYPRISFRVCPAQKRLSSVQRTRFDIMYDGRCIGCLKSDPKISGNGKSTRSWVAQLYEGYNESAFRSGRNESEPYTAVNKNRVVLFNPHRLTFDEAKVWSKHNLNKEFL
jgi:hypothetical protein